MTTEKLIRTRFAPSPTGFIHIGNFRTALFSHLWAKHNGGSSTLRIEDTDQSRKVDGAIEHLLKIMKIMGTEFDEGYYLQEDGTLAQKGEYGPYLQSERLGLYQKHVQELLDNKKAYYCFCSEQRLEELRKEQVALKKPPMYDRHCRNLTLDEAAKKREEYIAAGKNPVVRFAIPDGQTVVDDVVYGKITYDNSVLDDQVILKSDNFPTYHLAVVVDDHFMEITHIIRGEEWIPSTPKHILLYQAFGWEAPLFAHAPLILNPDKSKLSKRQGDVTVEDYLNKGYLPEALVNFIVFLGWNPKTEQEIFSIDELIKQFELSNVNHSGAVLDVNKLDWMNGQYIKQKSGVELARLLKPYWEQAGFNITDVSEEYLSAIASLEKERLKKLSEIGERTAYFFKEPEYDASLLIWKKSDAVTTKKILIELSSFFEQLQELDFTKETLETKIKDFIAQNNYDNGSVLWPLRAALTGMDKSPGPFEVTSTLHLGLGKQTILRRLQLAASKL